MLEVGEQGVVGQDDREPECWGVGEGRGQGNHYTWESMDSKGRGVCCPTCPSLELGTSLRTSDWGGIPDTGQ